MKVNLPSLTLHGAEVLTGGVLRPSFLALSSGRIGGVGGVAVDLSGYAVLPGAIDLGGTLEPHKAVAPAVRALATAAARSGTTTLWVGVDWPERSAGLPGVRAQIGAITALRAALPVDLGIRLRVGSHGVETEADLLEALPRLPDPFVVFRHPPDPERVAAEAEFGGVGPLARHLCRLASAFDDRGLRYATEADPDGERRERFSMIGARAALRPAARGAAASARAMGEPVILGAQDIIADDRIGRGIAAVLLAEGLCDALASFGDPAGLRRLVRLIAESGQMPLGHAWALASAAPAGILRRSDRGGLVEGTRADLAIVDPVTLEVAATITAGALVHATADALERFGPALRGRGLAAAE